MTSLVGINCKDGVVIGADSATTFKKIPASFALEGIDVRRDAFGTCQNGTIRYNATNYESKAPRAFNTS